MLLQQTVAFVILNWINKVNLTAKSVTNLHINITTVLLIFFEVVLFAHRT